MVDSGYTQMLRPRAGAAADWQWIDASPLGLSRCRQAASAPCHAQSVTRCGTGVARDPHTHHATRSRCGVPSVQARSHPAADMDPTTILAQVLNET